MIQLTLGEAQVVVQTAPDGLKLLVASDPKSGIQVVLPLPEQAARSVGAALGSGLVVASHIPPTLPKAN